VVVEVMPGRGSYRLLGVSTVAALGRDSCLPGKAEKGMDLSMSHLVELGRDWRRRSLALGKDSSHR
jgi:hypothetical protein